MKKTAIIVAVLIVLLAASPVYASSIDDKIHTFTSGLSSIYENVIVRVSTAAAAIAIAGSAVKMLVGSEEDAEQAIKTIKVVCISLACLMLLPRVIVFGKNLISKGAWTPPIK